MDLDSLIGIVGAVGMILSAMIAGGGVAPFIDTQSILIVFGGTFFGVMYSNPLPVFLGSFGAMAKAFMPKAAKLDECVERMVELAAMSRKDGMMALEGQPVPDKFFEKGMQMLVDGADEQKLVKQMKSEIESMKARHASQQGAVQGWVNLAPAMGMIGTLCGLVGMLQNMSDPKAIGPAMAIALLTTLYGALVANCIAKPIAEKLEGYSKDESENCELIMEGIRGIQNGMNPRSMADLLATRLAPNDRAALEGL